MNIVLFGSGGYGRTYLKLIENYIEPEHMLCGVVDPFEKGSFSVPVFKSGEEFFASKINADLAIISTPISCHISQAKACIDKGLYVLCEKPVCSIYSDAVDLMNYAKSKNAKLGIGFQWSFSDSILKLKSDVKNGAFGKPISFKCCLFWQRDRDYYSSSSWKGRLKDENGNYVCDSIISNATAHYLHNIFFVSSSEPEHYDYITARANDIETFDTCVIKGVLKNGASFYYSASHCTDEYIEPVFEFKFENATVYYNQNVEDRLWAKMNDGRIIEYGAMQKDSVTAQKILKMLDGNAVCSVEDVLPHLKICNEITFGKEPVQLNNKVIKNNTVMVPGLCNNLIKWYNEEYLPKKEITENKLNA